MTDSASVQTLLSFVATGLLSVTIPTYALSVGFLDRARRIAQARRQRGAEDLSKRTREYATGSAKPSDVIRQVESIVDETKESASKSFALSATSAFLIPFLFFALDLCVVGYSEYFELDVGTPAVLVAEVLPLVIGSFWLAHTLHMVQLVALEGEDEEPKQAKGDA